MNSLEPAAICESLQGCGFFVSWGLVQIDKSHFELKAQSF